VKSFKILDELVIGNPQKTNLEIARRSLMMMRTSPRSVRSQRHHYWRRRRTAGRLEVT
jgi:hypothetical protein